MEVPGGVGQAQEGGRPRSGAHGCGGRQAEADAVHRFEGLLEPPCPARRRSHHAAAALHARAHRETGVRSGQRPSSGSHLAGSAARGVGSGSQSGQGRRRRR